MKVPKAVVVTTIDHLRTGGRQRCETVVLWLGRRNGDIAEVYEAYRPEQQVDIDYFRILPEGMRALMSRLRQTRMQILAQVHSHPEAAFHSRADDHWAIVRHEGALSLVVPDFAAGTSDDNFAEKAVAFRLDTDNAWKEVPFVDVLEIA